MRIALINENSQAAKNAQIENALKTVVEPMGHTVDNYGMYGTEGEPSLTEVRSKSTGLARVDAGPLVCRVNHS